MSFQGNAFQGDAFQVGAESQGSTDVTRGPLIIRREVRYWPIPAQQHNLLPLTATVQAPFAQDDWPVPRGYARIAYSFASQALNVTTLATPVGAQAFATPSVRRVQQDEQQQNFAVLQVQADSPVTPANWQNPVSLRYRPPDQQQNFALLQTPDAAPFVPPVWQNPAGAQSNVALRTWLQSLVTTTLATPAGDPFAPIPWPVPVGKQHPVDLRTWTQSPAVTPNDETTVLRAPLYAPLFTRRPQQPDQQQNRNVLDTTPAASPFVPPVWSNPAARRVQQPEALPNRLPLLVDTTNLPAFSSWINPVLRKNGSLSWTQPGVISAPTASPFTPVAFPNPVLRRIGIDGLTWVQSPAVPPIPFVPALFENPVLRKPGALSWTQSPAVPEAPAPFVPVAFPNPVLRKESFDLRTWLQSLSLPANVDQGKPFAQSDWPNPVRVPRNVAQSGMVFAPYPESIPPAPVVPDTGAVGGWWRPVYKRRRRDVPVEVTAPAIEAVREAVAVVVAAPVAPTKAQRQAVKAAEALFAEEMRQQWRDAYAYELRQLWAEELQQALAEQQRAEDDEIAALLLLSA